MAIRIHGYLDVQIDMNDGCVVPVRFVFYEVCAESSLSVSGMLLAGTRSLLSSVVRNGI